MDGEKALIRVIVKPWCQNYFGVQAWASGGHDESCDEEAMFFYLDWGNFQFCCTFKACFRFGARIGWPEHVEALGASGHDDDYDYEAMFFSYLWWLGHLTWCAVPSAGDACWDIIGTKSLFQCYLNFSNSVAEAWQWETTGGPHDDYDYEAMFFFLLVVTGSTQLICEGHCWSISSSPTWWGFWPGLFTCFFASIANVALFWPFDAVPSAGDVGWNSWGLARTCRGLMKLSLCFNVTWISRIRWLRHGKLLVVMMMTTTMRPCFFSYLCWLGKLTWSVKANAEAYQAAPHGKVFDQDCLHLEFGFKCKHGPFFDKAR